MRAATSEPLSEPSAARTEVGPWNRTLRIDSVVSLARDNAAVELAGAEDLFRGRPYVLVVGDASVPLGETFLVSAAAKEGKFVEARAWVRAQVAARHAHDGNLGFGLVYATDDVVHILQRSAQPAQVAVSVELIARLTTPPPPGQTHVLAISEGEVIATLVATPAPSPGSPSLAGSAEDLQVVRGGAP